MQSCEVARFEHAGDVRVMSIIEQDGGGLELREDLTGPSALIAYGDEEMSLRVAFAPNALPALLTVVGGDTRAALDEYMADERHDLVDLMDLCDAGAVRYSFAGIGSKGDISLRR